MVEFEPESFLEKQTCMFVNKDTDALYNTIALPELSVESQDNLIDTY